MSNENIFVMVSISFICKCLTGRKNDAIASRGHLAFTCTDVLCSSLCYEGTRGTKFVCGIPICLQHVRRFNVFFPGMILHARLQHHVTP